MRALDRFTIAAVAAAVGACSGLPTTASLGPPNELSRVEGSPTEVYTRIARGAVRCWFGTRGQLATTHIFHADTETGPGAGNAEITVHEREPAAPSPWGKKAFRISLKSVGEQTAIEVENLKLPEPTAAQLRADAFRWAAGGDGCSPAYDGVNAIDGARPPPAPDAKLTVRNAR